MKETKKETIYKILNSDFMSFVFSLISFIALHNQDILPSYNIISLFILIIFIMLYRKFCKFNKQYIGIVFISLLFSFLLILGDLSFKYIDSKNISIVLELIKFKSLFSLIGNFFLIYTVLNMIVPRICKVNADSKINKKINPKLIFCLCTILIFISYLPYFLSLFPGTLSSDSIGELNRAIEGVITSDHHPVFHILFIRLSYLIGNSLFHNLTAVVATYSVLQMLVLSLLFSYSITFLYKKNINLKLLFGILLFYMIIPIFGYYSVVMWKDVLFGAFALWLTIECYRMYEERNKISIKTCIRLVIASLLTVFFRNNAIYMYFILIFFSLLFLKGNYKKLIVMFIIVIGTYYVVKGPIFNYFSIRKSVSAEYIAIPMQQIGRMAYKDVIFTNEERNTIDNLLDVDIMKEIYNPKAFDDIKFNENYNSEYFDENKFSYLKLWVKLVSEYPTIAIESYSISTLGYWYPNIIDRAYENTIIENDLGLKTKTQSSELIQNYVSKMVDENIPIISLTWSIGTYLWVLIICLYIMYKRRGLKSIYSYIPVLGVWFTIMIATPVYNETRYIFCLFSTLPFLLAIPFISESKNNK